MKRWLLLASLVPALALGQIESVRREAVDGGVHQPVLTRAPALLHFVEAPYPPEAEAAQLAAEVALQVTLAADGSVAAAVVTRPAGHGFDQAALAAVRQFAFSPAEVDGVPSPIQIEYVYHFAFRPPLAPDAGPPLLQLATLKGLVIARGTRKRIAGATLRCGDDDGAPEATSGENGGFELPVPPGACRATVVANGFDVFHTTETLQAGESLQVNYYLMPKSQGYETVVHGEREKKEVVRRTLTQEELESVPGSFGDPIRVLEDLPGVARPPFESGQLIVRGASPDETDTLLDGVSIPLLYHLGGGPSVVNPQFLDKLDFYPGGFGARYGRAIGGIVDVTTRKGTQDTFHGEAKVDLLDANFYAAAPVAPNVTVTAAARRSYVDALLPLVLPNSPSQGTAVVVPVYWDYQVRVDVGKPRGATEGSSFYLMAFGSDDTLKIVASGAALGLDRTVQINVHDDFHILKGDWTYRKGKLTSVLTPFMGYTLESGIFGSTTFGVNDYSYGAREDLRLDVCSGFTARAGLDLTGHHVTGDATLPILGNVQYDQYPGSDPAGQSQTLHEIINSIDPAAYAEADFKWGPVTVTPGLRFSYDRIRGNEMTAVDPRLWVRYAFSDKMTLKASVGEYSMAPPAIDMEPPPLGTPSLQPQRAFQTSVGMERKLTDVINVDLTGYYNRRFQVVTNNGPNFINADGSVTSYPFWNNGLGRSYGLELWVRHEITQQFFGWIAYTLNRSEQRYEGQTSYYPAAFDQTHILTAIGSYRLPAGFELGARFRYVSGNPITPLTHPYDVQDLDLNSFQPVYGATNSARLPAFNQLDVRLDKFFVFKQWTLDVYVDVQNVYNAKNVEANTSDYRWRNLYYINGIPFLPILGVKGSF